MKDRECSVCRGLGRVLKGDSGESVFEQWKVCPRCRGGGSVCGGRCRKREHAKQAEAAGGNVRW